MRFCLEIKCSKRAECAGPVTWDMKQKQVDLLYTEFGVAKATE